MEFSKHMIPPSSPTHTSSIQSVTWTCSYKYISISVFLQSTTRFCTLEPKKPTPRCRVWPSAPKRFEIMPCMTFEDNHRLRSCTRASAQQVMTTAICRPALSAKLKAKSPAESADGGGVSNRSCRIRMPVLRLSGAVTIC